MVNSQLNYDEAIRRLDYWANTPSQCDSPFAHSAIRIVITSLQIHRNNLYFEPKETTDVRMETRGNTQGAAR